MCDLSKDPMKPTLPPGLELIIARAIAREMRRSKFERSVLEFLVSRRGIKVPQGADSVLDELLALAITKPRCSICGNHFPWEEIERCSACGRRYCKECSAQDACRKCAEAARASQARLLLESIWCGVGIFGVASPQMLFFYLLTEHPLAALYSGISLTALCVWLAHQRSYPWKAAARLVTWR